LRASASRKGHSDVKIILSERASSPERPFGPRPAIATAMLSRRVVEVLVLLGAAIFEVGGDAMIRSGLRGRGWLFVALGVATLGAYGVIVNLLPLDFSKALASYVALFALVSVVFGRVLFREAVPVSTWIGLLVILVGSAIVQFGSAK
jgi:small multidrug resistance family-3 protein